ncbi:MAG: DUF3488 domain-containing protein, partial [Oscillospiraceae bacterium]|nr:DUF3488 domain-containing protein [Oscillospiraceae bacterium]
MKNIIKSILFPCLLSFTVLASILYIYEQTAVFPLALAAVFLFNALFFALYEKLRLINRKIIIAPVILLIGIIAFFLATELIRSRGWTGIRAFNSWFFRTGDDLDIPIFTAALMTLFVPFISSTMFYFTLVRYNAFFLMLICMITFALYAKTFTEIPFIFPSLIIALFLFISIEKRWYRRLGFRALSYGKFMAVGGGFVALSAYIAGLFPPVEITPYREQFDEFITGQSIRLINSPDYTLESDTSSGASDENMNKELVLFTVKASEPGYLRRQVFDKWNGEAWERGRLETGLFIVFGDSPRESSPAVEWRKFFSANGDIAGGLDFWRQAPAPGLKSIEIKVMTDYNFYFLPLPQYPAKITYERSSVVGRSIRDDFFSFSGGIRRMNHVYTAEYYDNRADGEFLSKLTPDKVAALEDGGMTFYMNDIFPDEYANYMAECL